MTAAVLLTCRLLFRLKLSGNEMTPNGSPSTGATPNATPRNDEKAAAIAALTDLMDELEELSVRVDAHKFQLLFPFMNSELLCTIIWI